MLLFYIFIFLFGLIIGSFLNVVIFRMETGEQVVNGRSHCRHCNHILEWYDLFPVLSFLVLNGKCRYCKKWLSAQYPLVEFGTAILFLLIFNFQFLNPISGSVFFYFLLSTSYLLFIISSLVVIFVYDLRHYIIPDKIVYPAIAVSLIYLLFSPLTGGLDLFVRHSFSNGGGFGIFNPFLNGLFASVLAGGFFFAIVVATKGAGMGGGDVKLAFLMGLALGWPKILIALFLAFTSGAICGIIFIIAKKMVLKSAIPFGPFLVLGTFIALFWGDAIIRWYEGYFF